MKQKDIALFLVIAIFSSIISVVASNFLITPAKSKLQSAEIVDPISASFVVPANDDKYFNPQANNPTRLIKIGDDSNAAPFNGAAN